jgi:hypothetical protein
MLDTADPRYPPHPNLLSEPIQRIAAEAAKKSKARDCKFLLASMIALHQLNQGLLSFFR